MFIHYWGGMEYKKFEMVIRSLDLSYTYPSWERGGRAKFQNLLRIPHISISILIPGIVISNKALCCFLIPSSRIQWLYPHSRHYRIILNNYTRTVRDSFTTHSTAVGGTATEISLWLSNQTRTSVRSSTYVRKDVCSIDEFWNVFSCY